MEYHEAANFLFDLRRYSPRTGVESTRRLLDYLDAPDDGLRVVQIAGSNGKGSTARMVERILREAGYDVGLYTSPHLDDIRERVRIDGRKVPKAAVTEFVEEVEPYVTDEAAEGQSPTFFETTTALAVWAFARADVDIAVLEVGIGGKHDATSAVDAEAAAVTSVTLEHADILGDTVEEIARDKAAVVPEDKPLVTATTGGVLAAVKDVAGDVVRVGEDDDADVRVTDRGREDIEQAVDLSAADWSARTHLALLGSYQARNAGVAAALARQLGSVAVEDIERGLRNASWPGRFEVMEQAPLVVLDGAHNPGSCEGVSETLGTFDYDDLHLVFGAMCDKDHAGMADALPTADHVYTCRPDFERAESIDALAAVFEDDAETVDAVGSVTHAVETAVENAGEDDAVLVCGSLFVVAEARRRWTREYVPKRVPDIDTAADVLEGANVTEGGVYRMRGKGVHRVLATRVRPKQAAYLKQELLSLGGECATSGVDAQDRELVDVVLMGTLSQFKRLSEKLQGQPDGLPAVGTEIREALGIQYRPETGDYPWADGTAIMGILNVTPDSFHDGGRYDTLDDAVERAERMVENGADIIDVGGESTRPGADPVPIEEEIDRVVPVVEALAETDALVSVDTRKADVARAALDAGADILNDVSGLEDPEMRLVAADYDVPVVVMHSIETPVDPGADVEYDDVVADTIDSLTERVLLAEKAGLDRSQIIVDPGLGFGKSAAENFELLGRVDEFRALGCPILVGHSHKSMFGLVDDGGPDERLASTVAGSAIAAERGADIVRVHDVAENAAAVRTAEAAADPERFAKK
ncbi:dihydropteroate synthase [Natronomonas halophila]|uniref:dihydropteroate synthase n=1 Tax=Natronomonas halophila TaxID=2747817 RepID=UPI0015B6B973|nr:dihydropteroate synthase [Natronomonas halophila]QLD86577.1 dihydropteroate synthase [Natronomonas halophila]